MRPKGFSRMLPVTQRRSCWVLHLLQLMLFRLGVRGKLHSGRYHLIGCICAFGFELSDQDREARDFVQIF